MDPMLKLSLLEPTRFAAPTESYAELLGTAPARPPREARWLATSQLAGAVPAGVERRVRSLAGIEAWPGLTTLYLAHSDVADLAPLAGLPELRLLYLDGPADIDPTPLLACPDLVRVHFGQTVSTGREVLHALAARGVQVDNLLPPAHVSQRPFACENLKLAVLDALQDVVELPETHAFDEYAYDEDNLAAVLATPVTQEQFDSIEVLEWLGGGHETPHLVWQQWDGESDEFDITSLAGIEVLRNLRELRTSLDPLPPEEIEALRARGVDVDEW